MSNRKDWYRNNHPKASVIRNMFIWVLVIAVAIIVVLGGYFIIRQLWSSGSKPVSLEGDALQSSQPAEQERPDQNTKPSKDISLTEESLESTSPEPEDGKSVEEGQTVAEGSEEKSEESSEESSEPEKIVIPPIPERSYAVVVLDPGHGGVDGGCDVTIDGVMYKEKDIDLAVALYVRDYLEQMDNIQVYMTRETDKKVSLDDRPVVGNEKQADLFVSFHCNSFTKDTAKGLECYSHENSAESGKISEKLIACLKNAGLDTKIRGTRTADYKVLRESYYAAVLFEMGFMTNAEDLKNLTDDDYQKQLAKALADAIYSVVKK